ncbi:MAG TPA: NifU family protein [Solirubrobacteraceae bacterium]
MSDFTERARRLDAARRRAAALPEGPREVAADLAEALDEHLASVLRTVVTQLRADERGRELLYDLVDDAEVHAALVKAGLVRQTVAMRAMQVLESVRPYITSHGGDVELVAIEDGVARVRLSGNCQGCGSSSVTMHQVIHDAMLEHVPEIHAVEDAGPPVLAPLGGAAIALPMAQVPGRAPAA